MRQHPDEPALGDMHRHDVLWTRAAGSQRRLSPFSSICSGIAGREPHKHFRHADSGWAFRRPRRGLAAVWHTCPAAICSELSPVPPIYALSARRGVNALIAGRTVPELLLRKGLTSHD
jgi:hypothetical protein